MLFNSSKLIRVLASLLISSLVLAGSAACEDELPNGPNGFSNYLDPAHLNGAPCAFSLYYNTTSRYYLTFTPWTPPFADGVVAYAPTTLRAVMGVVPMGSAVLPPPLYPSYEVAIYDDHLDFMGSEVDDLSPLTNHVRRYKFQRDQNGVLNGITFNPIPGATLVYVTGGGTFYPQAYEVIVDLSAATEVLPPGEFTLEPGHRYWYSLAGVSGIAEHGYPCVARTLSNHSTSQLPDPTASFPMSTAQCADWGQPPGCIFQMATQDYGRVGEPSPGEQFCSRAESPVNPVNSAFAPRLPVPNCFNNTTYRPCCQRTYINRFAYGLDVVPVLADPTPTPTPTATPTNTPTPTRTPRRWPNTATTADTAVKKIIAVTIPPPP